MANGLGRGLGSLIPQKNNKAESAAAEKTVVLTDQDKVFQIEVDKIDLNPMQPRKRFTDFQIEELVNSIKEYGIIQPLIVSRKAERYELIAGERRLRAAKILGLKKVPAIIRSASRQEKLEIALIENIQRENLNPIDLASAYQRLISEFNLTQEQVAKKVGKSRSSVTNTLRMLSLPEEIRLALIDGRINEGQAKYILGMESEAKQMKLFRKIIRSGLTVDEVSREVKRMGGTKAARIKINYADKDKEFVLREFFGAKAEIKRKGRGGQIIINFYSDEELEEIIDKIKK